MTEQLNWTEITHIHQIVYIHSHIQWKTQNLVSNVTETSILYRKNSLLGLFFTLTLLPHSQHFRHQMRGFSTILQQPAGCPTIQFSSDTLYQESVNDHTGQGFSPTTLPQFRCQFQAPDWYFEFTSYKSDFPLSPSQVWWLARKAHRIQGNTFTYWFTAKDKVEDTDEQGFHGSPDGKESACNVGEQGLIPGLIPPPLEEGMATHSSILAWRTPMDRGIWRATVHGVAESDTTKHTHRWTARCRHQGQAHGKGHRAHTLSRQVISQCLHTFASPKALQIPYFERFTEASAHSHDQSLSESLDPLAFPEGGGWGTKSQTYNHGAVLPVPRPHPEGAQEPTESCVIRTKTYWETSRGSDTLS